MELGGDAGIAALARSALTTGKQSSSDTGSSTSAGPLRCTIPVFFMLLVQVDLGPPFAAAADDTVFMPSSEPLSLLCDLSGEGRLLFGRKKDKLTREGVSSSSAV